MVTRTQRALCGLALLLAAACTAAADGFPARPIRIIVNSSPGALLDATTRAVAQKMAEQLGQPVIVENNAGAAGMLGIRQVKHAAPDGYTLLAAANTVAQLPALRLDPGYDLGRDFTGVGMMNRAPLVLVGTPAQPFKTLADFVAYAKAQPEKLSFATAGTGTSTHMAAAMFLHQAGVKMTLVPYKGNAAAIPDVVGGRVNLIFDGANSSLPLVKEGKLRAFAVSSPKRLAALPETPTVAEQGYAQYSFYVYMGLLAPAGTPKPVLQRLAQALRQAQASDVVRDRFARDSAEAGTLSPDEFSEFLEQDHQRTVRLVSDLGLLRE